MSNDEKKLHSYLTVDYAFSFFYCVLFFYYILHFYVYLATLFTDY